MTTAASLLASLRTAGILIQTKGGRLLVEAPRGTITSEIRAQLANRKTKLISILEQEEEHKAKDATSVEALIQVAALLATAYQRWQRVPKIPEVSGEALNARLALPARQSVHGCELP